MLPEILRPKNTLAWCIFTALLFCTGVLAQSAADECLLSSIKHADETESVKEIKKRCGLDGDEDAAGAMSRRIAAERSTEFNPYVITPHRMNYILPYARTSGINRSVYTDSDEFTSRLDDIEVKFQMSYKVPLQRKELFIENDGLYFGITIKSFWQLYANGLSSPFRETNYRPELFYLMPLNWHPHKSNTALVFGVEHESNGRGLPLSRSWNRVFVNFLYEKENFALSFRPWYRLEEDPKESPTDPGGDDNPDIEDYMGHFELLSAYQWSDYEVNLTARRNFSKGNGAVELGFTFPLSGRVRGYFQYFDGYGESLIDYDHKQSRIGLGIALTDLL